MSDPDQPQDQRPEDESGDAEHSQSGNGEAAGNGGSGTPDPFAELLNQFGLGAGNGPIDINQLMGTLQSMFGGALGGSGAPFNVAGFGVDPATVNPSNQGKPGALNWDQVRQATRQLSAQSGPDPSPSQTQQRQLADDVRLAELWLDQVTDFPQVGAAPQVWSRAEWIEQTLGSWKPVVDPIVSSLAEAMKQLIGQQAEQVGADDPMAQMAQMMSPMLGQMASSMYQLQFAQALSTLSQRVVSGSEIGFQLLSTPRVALIYSTIDKAFAELDLPMQDVRLYLTLREAARQRLFNHVGWLGPQLLALLEHYASQTRIDQDAVESALDIDGLDSLSPDKFADLASQLQGKLFEPTKTPEQLQVLERLETLLALTEGWVDDVVNRAAAQWMPSHAALAETIRRRRGTGGPAEGVFASLVGLELRPRRVRDAATLWAAVGELRGQAERDQLWAHPDVLPSTADLDDPVGFATMSKRGVSEPDEMDLELAKLLDAERDD